MLNEYSFINENSNNPINFVYYILVFILGIIKSLSFINSLYIIILFLVIALNFIYSLTINNYKIIPTKKVGIILYYFRIALKLSYYILIVHILKINNSFNIFILCVIIMIYIFIEKMIEKIYLNYKNIIFYSFSDEEIEMKYKEKANEIFNRYLNKD